MSRFYIITLPTFEVLEGNIKILLIKTVEECFLN